MTELRRIPLKTGVTLNVSLAGDRAHPAVILLHGFPESHRTWREIAPLLQERFFLVMPDQRGFAGSDKPQSVDDYATDILLADIDALADALSIERFALVGHDWGGAIAWAAAIRRSPRMTRLAIVNSPHPWIFQKSLFNDREQRAASQYIRAFRNAGMEQAIARMGFDTFFDKSFARHVPPGRIGPEERQIYLDDWRRPGALTGMFNWYRASRIEVPADDDNGPAPEWLARPFPKIVIPTLVIWGMQDQALLPLQLDGLEDLIDDLTVVRLPQAGHFAPWEAAPDVARALEPFLAPDGKATATPA